jgi:hypothetical protein
VANHNLHLQKRALLLLLLVVLMVPHKPSLQQEMQQ